MKNREKKGHPIVCLGPYYRVVLIELTFFFLTKYVCDSIVFSMNNLKKNDLRALCILEKLRFLTKYGHNSRMFFREWTIFDKIWA